jgi:hypothetical protein
VNDSRDPDKYESVFAADAPESNSQYTLLGTFEGQDYISPPRLDDDVVAGGMPESWEDHVRICGPPGLVRACTQDAGVVKKYHHLVKSLGIDKAAR